MNNLKQIAKDIEDGKYNNLVIMDNPNNETDYIQLNENRGYDWDIYYTITEDNVNVIEMNYDCACQKQSDENVPTLEDALNMASQWC
jgi:hypothetical protein